MAITQIILNETCVIFLGGYVKKPLDFICKHWI